MYLSLNENKIGCSFEIDPVEINSLTRTNTTNDTNSNQ